MGHVADVPGVLADGTRSTFQLAVNRVSERPERYSVWVRRHGRGSLLERVEEAAGLGGWDWNLQTGELFWSDNHYRLWGLEVGAIEPSTDFILEHTHPDDRVRLRRYIEGLRRNSGPAQVEYRAIRVDGSSRYFLATTAVIEDTDRGPTRMIGSLLDISELRRAERELTAHVAVSAALAEWQSLDTGARALVGGLAEALGFVAGGFWVVVEGRLMGRVFWQAPSIDLEPFTEAESRLRLRPGEGIVGHAWEARRPIHWTDVSVSEVLAGADAAAAADLHSAVAIPAVSGDEVLAVVALFARERVGVSSRLMQSLVGVGHEVGEFLDHRRGELLPPTLSERELEVLQHAARGESGREIAEALFVSPATVKSHLENIYRKLGVSDRAEAVAHGVRNGLID
ncbi:MAG TPA: LuxR C-terminal-related transcriptional regulator [Thermoleophilaceae bacterium]|nr:LuxR C-terminal-related transcriptional regulator [Thermoleophilaceae bacterium]